MSKKTKEITNYISAIIGMFLLIDSGIHVIRKDKSFLSAVAGIAVITKGMGCIKDIDKLENKIIKMEEKEIKEEKKIKLGFDLSTKLPEEIDYE